MAAKKKPLFAESTEVEVQKSAAEITAMLVESGAAAISTNYKDGKIESLSFVMPYGGGRIPYLLPVRTEPVYQRLKKGKDAWRTDWNKLRAQAERVAWRQLYWWLKSQLALIELGMVEPAEVLMPYMLGPDGRSFFDTYKPRMITAPAAETKGGA